MKVVIYGTVGVMLVVQLPRERCCEIPPNEHIDVLNNVAYLNIVVRRKYREGLTRVQGVQVHA